MLTKTTEDARTWYPTPIHDLDNLLIKSIHAGRGYRHSRALRSNISYSLQHIEFLHRCTLDIKLSGVLKKQTWKSMIVVGCGIVESLLDFLLVAKNAHSKTEWELVAVAPGNTKTLDGEKRKIDSHIYRKLPAFVPKPMSFDIMIEKAKSKKVLGSNNATYQALQKLRPLRNRVHLQIISSDSDTDWNAFSREDVCLIADVLHSIFTSNIFRPSNDEISYFDFLLEYRT